MNTRDLSYSERIIKGGVRPRQPQLVAGLRSWLIPEWIEQLMKYALVGVLNTLIDGAAYFILTRWLGFGSWPVLAKGLGYAIGMTNSFFWNRNWTFQSRGNIWRSAGMFVLTHIGAVGINAGLMALGLQVLQLSELASLIGATSGAFLWNFLLNRLVVFRT